MCGLLGYVAKKKFGGLQEAIKLVFESKIRGLHAFGITRLDPSGKLDTVKSLNIKNIPNIIEYYKPQAFIYHNRYSTSGDYEEIENNQPIHIEAYGFSFAFNGIISQATKEQMEAEYGPMYTYNDGEIIVKILEKGQEVCIDFLKKNKNITISALAMYSDRIDYFTNGKRPLWRYETDDALYVTSTRDVLARVFGEDVEAVSVEPNTFYSIPLGKWYQE